MFRIALVGPDGSGKTTLAQKLIFLLEEDGYTVGHLHFSGAKQVPYTPKKIATGGHRSRSGFSEAVVLIVRWLRARRRFCEAKIGRVDVIVEERTFLDQWVDPQRYALSNGSRPMVLSLNKLLPSPDVVAQIVTGPRTVALRKNELSPEETARQMGSWRVLNYGDGRVLNIDTANATPGAQVEKILAFSRELRVRDLRQTLKAIRPLPRRLNVYASSTRAFRASGTYRPSKFLGLVARYASFRSTGSPSNFAPEIFWQSLKRWNGVLGDICVMQSYLQDKFVVFGLKSGSHGDFLKFFWGETMSRGKTEWRALNVLARHGPKSFVVPRIKQVIESEGFLALCLSSAKGRAVFGIGPRRKNVLETIRDDLEKAKCGVRHTDLSSNNVWFTYPPGVVDWEDAIFSTDRFV